MATLLTFPNPLTRLGTTFRHLTRPARSYADTLREAQRLARHWRKCLGVTGTATFEDTQRLAIAVRLPDRSVCNPNWGNDTLAVRTADGWDIEGMDRVYPYSESRNEDASYYLALAVLNHLMRVNDLIGTVDGIIPAYYPKCLREDAESAVDSMGNTLTAVFIEEWDRLDLDPRYAARLA